MVSWSWNGWSKENTFWEDLYKDKWKTRDIVKFGRMWKDVFKDRIQIERNYLEPKREEFQKREMQELVKCKARSEEEMLSVYRYNTYLAFGDLLRESADKLIEEVKIKMLLVSNEEYATCIAVSPTNYIALFNWGYLLHHLAKLVASKKHPKADSIFKKCFSKYEYALSLKGNIIKEDTLSRWGDALHDYAKTKKTQAEVEECLRESYSKYEQSITFNPNYIAFDYWGLTLCTHAKLKKHSEKEADKLYAAAVEKYASANALKPGDGFILCHWASTLQSQASLKDGREAKLIFHESFERYRDSARLMPQDPFTVRSWGDALHDCSKKLIQEAEDTECSPERRQELLEEASILLIQASTQFATALSLRNDYSNAMNNWALSLSTHAKILPPEQSEKLFSEAYSKFQKALEMTSTDRSFIICNWAMTMVSQARKRYTPHDKNNPEYWRLLNEAKEKLLCEIEKGDTWGLFCMARWCSVVEEVDQCREWLTRFQAQDNYLPRATKGQMAYFKNVSHLDWFKELMAKGREINKDLIDFS
eukprot:TRINITY_DN17309_c0_g1_i1.p1 TRINITY_DN17309_c0_g1~~TRINITY_DN17309_c0_g1_i1.p1  ORF type:complete len:610 (+),score=147.23 TRINITY_DN17309_c0_g1_i1:227-1831(+)